MKVKRMLTVQDLSCVGQCSLTVALPILSSCGIETSVLPSAVLSTHTAGFTGFTCHDLGADFPGIVAHWKKEGIKFDAVYTGYLGTTDEIDCLLSAKDDLLNEGGLFIVDPAMGDNGKLYPAFGKEYADAMKRLVAASYVTLPNITEACYLTDTEYRDDFSEEELRTLLGKVVSLGAKKAVFTGVPSSDGKIGVLTYENGEIREYFHEKCSEGCHGTGDIYSSVFTGKYVNGASLYDAAKTAADFTYRCIHFTKTETDHKYGAYFEPFLKELGEAER